MLTLRHSEAAPAVELHFAPCAENPAADCGTLHAPVDYRQMSAEWIPLRIVRVRSTHPPGVDFVQGGLTQSIVRRLRKRFDSFAWMFERHTAAAPCNARSTRWAISRRQTNRGLRIPAIG